MSHIINDCPINKVEGVLVLQLYTSLQILPELKKVLELINLIKLGSIYTET